jgi:Trypsin
MILRRTTVAVVAAFAVSVGSGFTSLRAQQLPLARSACEESSIQARVVGELLAEASAKRSFDPAAIVREVGGGFVSAYATDPCIARGDVSPSVRSVPLAPVALGIPAGPLGESPTYLRNEVQLLRSVAANVRVFGGVADSRNKFSDTVALFAGGRSEPVCTGVLVGDQVVMTAGHCLCLYKDIDMVAFGPNALNALATFEIDDRRNFAKCELDGNDNLLVAGLIGHDYAFVKLNSKVPKAISWTRRVADIKQLFGSNDGRAVGYGVTESSPERTGERRIADVAMATRDCRETGAADTYGCAPGLELVALDARSVRDTCNGDSGGPIYYADGRTQYWYVIGLTSRGLPGGKCGQGGVYTLLRDEIFRAVDQFMGEQGVTRGVIQ